MAPHHRMCRFDPAPICVGHRNHQKAEPIVARSNVYYGHCLAACLFTGMTWRPLSEVVAPASSKGRRKPRGGLANRRLGHWHRFLKRRLTEPTTAPSHSHLRCCPRRPPWPQHPSYVRAAPNRKLQIAIVVILESLQLSLLAKSDKSHHYRKLQIASVVILNRCSCRCLRVTTHHTTIARPNRTSTPNRNTDLHHNSNRFPDHNEASKATTWLSAWRRLFWLALRFGTDTLLMSSPITAHLFVPALRAASGRRFKFKQYARCIHT